MNDTVDFRIHRYSKNGVRDKKYELKAYLIRKYIMSLGNYNVSIRLGY